MNTLNKNGLQIIKRFQGLKLKAYKCPAGIWTIGYGHTKNVKSTDVIDQEKAQFLLIQDLQYSINGINKLIKKIQLDDNKFSALVSFVFNLGIGSLQISTLYKKIIAKDFKGAAIEFRKWNKIKKYKDGKPYYCELVGLTLRRYAQQLLFSDDDITFQQINKLVQHKRKTI